MHMTARVNEHEKEDDLGSSSGRGTMIDFTYMKLI